MNLLALDTSTENVSIAIIRKDCVDISFNRRMRFGSSKVIVFIERYLKKIALDIRDVDAFIIGAGPGSFTGLRVSFSLVKGFALALGKPVISINSFYSIAYPLRKKHCKISVISDAKKNMIYAASFIVKNGILKQEKKEILARLSEYVTEKKDYFFVTSDIHLRQTALLIEPKVLFCDCALYPNVKYLLDLAIQRYNTGEFNAIDTLEPLYLHPKTCQIK